MKKIELNRAKGLMYNPTEVNGQEVLGTVKTESGTGAYVRLNNGSMVKMNACCITEVFK